MDLAPKMTDYKVSKWTTTSAPSRELAHPPQSIAPLVVLKTIINVVVFCFRREILIF